jgi:hypothetical protein
MKGWGWGEVEGALSPLRAGLRFFYPWSVARRRSNLKGKQVVMYFCIQNNDIAPERNERRLCGNGIESVMSFKKESKKKM